MPRKKPASSLRSKQPRKKLLLETCEDRILCSATTPTNDAPEAPAALDPATTTAIVATTPDATQVSSSAVAAGATAAERAEIAAALPADATTSSGTAQLTDEQRAELADVVRESTNEIWFQKNEGQFGEGVLYGFKTGFGSMMVYADHLQLLANQVNTETGEVGVHAVDITFDGANAGWEIVPGGESGVLGSYQNEDGTALTPGVFKELTIRNVYNGVDLRLYSAESATLEFDWLVARAADYTKIAMNFTGQDGITYAADGAATLDLRFQDLTLKMPEVYQVIDGEKIAVTSAMVAGEQPGQMRYAISGLVDENAPLVIDPNVVWATYFDLDAAAPAFDSYLFSVTANANATYASGWVREIITNANYGPTGAINQYMQVNAGFAQGTLANQIYIYRFSNDGLNITAWTSTGIVSPTGGVSNQKLANMASDLELFPDGRVILGVSSGQIQIYSTNLATRSFNATPVTMDMLNSVAVVSNDAFYVGGRVAAAIPVGEIPAANIGPDATFAGALEGVIVRYTNALTTPTAAWATYVGGTSDEYFTGVAMTPDMTKLVFAVTTASNAGLPGLVNAVDSTIAGATEILTGVITDSATTPAAFDVFSYLGGSSTEGNVGGSDTAAAVVTATDTHYFVAGTTSSNDMPSSAGGGQAAIGGGAYDTFASRIPVNGSLGTGFQTTYLGGTGDDRIGGIAYDIRADRLLVFGTTTGSFPTLDTSPPSNYFDSSFGGGTYDIFVATFNGALTTKDFATYLGGSGNDYLGQTGELFGQGHVFYNDATGLSYLATTVHSTDIPTNVIGTAAGSPPGKDRVKSNGGSDSHIIFAFNINNNDYGDAPASYDNGTQTREGLSNTILIGAAVDAEAVAQNSADATGDDIFTSDDEDGIATVNNIAVGQTSYSTTVSVFNNSGAARTLQGWIDFNRDGLFQVGEFASVSVPVNAAQQNVTLTWASLPALTTGQSFLRIRLSDNALTDNAGTANVDERSVGSGSSGEIEDYGLIISQSSISGTVYRDLNNNGAQLGAGETGIQTVTVTLTGTNDIGGAVNVSTTTDASGNYTFANIRPSDGTGYTITETQPTGFLDGLNTVGTAGGSDGNPPPGDAITGVIIGTNIAATGYLFGELPPALSSLAGTVYRDNNNSGAIDGGETGIDGVTVTLIGVDDLGAAVNVSTTTAGGGLYSFTNLRPSDASGYTITEMQPVGFLDGNDAAGTEGGSAAAIPGDAISSIVLAANTNGTAYIFGELNPVSLSGSVYGDLDTDGVFDAFESGIPGATVTLTGTDDLGAITPIVATTNAAGAYSFTNLRPGTYTITETQPSGYADGADTLGTGLTAPNNAGSAAVSDIFSGIVFSTVSTGNDVGANYNFGESPNFGLTKSLQATSSNGTSGSNLTLGETATFRLVATIPAGSFTNFQLQDALPAGFQFVNGSALVSLVSSAGQLTSSTLSGAGLAQTSVGTPTFAMPDAAVSNNSASNVDTYTSGTDVFFKLGNLTNTDTNGGTTESVVIEFQAVVVNEIANQNGTTLDNTFSVLLDKDGTGDPDPHGPPSNTITSTLAEPVLSLTKTATAPGTVGAGDTVNYTVVFTNNGVATAFDSLITDLMPADILITSITGTTLAGSATADSAAAITGGGTGFSGQYDIPVGGSVTINYVGTVQISAAPGAIETNTATLTWTSINGGNSTAPDANERFGAAGSVLGDGSLNDYRVQSSQTVTVGTATFDKQLFSTGDTNTSGSDVAIAETVTYALVVTVPAGTAPSLSIVDTLPAGLQFVSSSIVTTAAASNGLLTADFNGTVPSPTVTGGASDGDDVTFAFGSIVAGADGDSTNNTFLVLVNTLVTNAVANSGLTPQTTLPNSATFDIPGDGVPPSTPPPVSITVVEPQLTIDKQFDVAQADAGDTVTISIVVNNTGTGPSYDTLITDVVDTAKFGSIANVTTPAGFTFNSVAGTVTYSGGTIADGGSATFVFTAKLLDVVNATETLSNTASAVGTSQPGVVVGERTTPTVQSTDTLDVPGVLDVTKSIVTPGATVQIGDTITYSVVVRIVEGTTSTLSLVDNLPSNETYVPGSATISATDAGVTVNGFAANLVADVLTMTATSVVNAGNVDSTSTDSDTFTITYQAVVRDIAGNVRGTNIINNLNATAGGGLTDPNNTATTTVIEPELRVVKAVSDATADLGQTLHFTLTVTHTAASDATAYDILVRDALPSGLAGLTGILVNGVAVGSSPLVDTDNSTGTLLDLKLSQLAVGDTITVEFDATVGTGAALVGTNIDNNARIYWDTTPAENPNAVLTAAADGDEDRDYGATGADETFNLDTEDAQDTERLTVNANSISGTVYQDVNANGAFDSGTDAAISGAEVTLSGTTFFGEVINLVATTDVNGVYTFDNVPRGTYTLTETQPAGFVDGAETAGTPFGGTVSPALDSNTISTLTVPVGAQSGTDYNFGEVLGSALSGLVYSDANNDGIVQGGETLLDGVTVQITGTDFLGQTVNTTVSTAAGAYSFADLRPGTYTITETTPGGFFDGKETVGTQASGTIDNTQDSDTIANITLAQNVNGSGNNFGELAPASLGGFVYVDAGNDGVRGVGETPVVGATITLTGTDDRGNLVNTVATSAAGTGAYAFNNLRPGSYTITETQPAGLLDGKETQGTPGGGTVNADEFATIPLTAGTTGADNNFGELRPASLAGFVYTDANNDGIKLGAGETGVGGVTITLTGTDDLGAITPIVLTTAPDGSYNFGNLRPGTYTITETQPASHLDGTDTIGTPGGATANDVFSNVVITEGVDGTNNNFGELLAATISGNVYRDLNNDGIQLGAGETGIGGVTVTLTGTNDLGAIAPIVLTSAPDGTYSFGTLRPGTYTVTETQPAGFLDGTDTAGSPGGGTAGNDVISTITVASGITSANNNFGELPGTSLSGTVYRDFNNDGFITPGETGVGSVNVTLTGTDDLGASVNITIATQPDGTYTFQNLRPGTYSVSEAQPAGLLDGKDTAGTSGGTPGAIGTDSITLITLPASTSATDYNFGELNPASLSGNVYADLDGDGVFDGFESGIRGATVTLSGTNDLGAITSIVATTDANGAYSFTNLRPGTYTITETQPADYTDGADTLGTGLTAPNSAGTAGNDVMSGITLASVAPGNNTGSNYNFGEQPNFTLTKTLVNTSEAGTSGSNVAIGETATFRLVVTIPVGSLTNFQVQDLLPAGYQYVNGSARAGLVGALTSSTITAPLAGVGSTPTFVLADASVSDNALTNSDGYVSGTDVFFKFGDITNTDATAAVEAIVIEFDAVVVNEAANVAGTTLTNSFGILYERNGLPDPDPDPNPNPPPPVTTTVVSPQLTLTKSGTPTSGLEAGDNVTYTLTLTNPGGANASTAFDARILDVLPADLRATAINNVALNGGATTDSALAITGGGTGLDGQFDIPVGGSVVITYTANVQVSVNPGASETNNAELTWTSINGGNSSSPDAGERYGAPGTIFGDTNLNNLRVTDSETVTVASGTFSKVLFGSSDPGTLGSNVAVGETVIYGLVITLPAGTTQTLNATDALPAGLQFVSSQIVTNAALSNGFITADFNGTVPSPVVTGGVNDGDDVFFTFSNIVANADGVSGNNTFLLLVSARVTDVAGNSGSPQTTLPNVATFDDPNDPPTPFTPPPVTVDVVEPVLEIAKDFNVAQADAGDTVQISIVVNNTGNGPAYDVVVDDAVNLAKFGSITAVTTPAGFTFNNVAGNVSYTGGTIAAGESATFVFSVKLTDAVNPSEALNNIATATGTSQPGVVVGERTFGPVSDDATLNVPAVFTLTKGITSPAGGTVKIGDLVTYSVNVTLLEGTTNNISLTDLLPAGMTYLNGSAVVSNANGMTVNGFAANAVGNTLSISATSIVNPGNVDNTATTDSATFTITYQAVVDDVAGNVSGTLLTNSLTGGGDGTPPSTPPPVTTTVTEPQLQISKLVDDATANLGQTLHFTLTIQNLNVVNGADAYDLLVRDALPAGLAGLANIVVNGATVEANNSTGSLLDLKLSQLALGATATITFDATVDTNAALIGTNIDNNARLYWDSQPGESDNSVLTGTPDGDGDRDYGATGADEVFDATTDPAQDTERVSVNANTISGTIYQDVNENGVFNLGTDTGLNAQTVTLTGNLAAGGAAFTLTTTTDINGNYTFNNVPAGTYVITETQPAGYVDGAETAGTPFGGSVSAALGSNVISSIVVPGGATDGTGYNFGEVLTSTFAGSVYQDVNDDGARGSEPGIGGVTITLTGTDFLGQSVTFTTTTNSTGDFNFDGGANGLRPGTYTITETTQPAGYPDGKDTSGTPSGTVTNDVISNITIAQNTTASGYLFGELFPFDPVKSIVSTSNVGTTGNNVTIGETVRYRLVVALPGGLLNDYVIADKLPSGISFLDDGTASLAFVSSNGTLISSSTLGTAAGATDPSATPSFTLPATAISNSANSDADGWSNGTDVFFRLGNLTNTDDVGRQYVIVEFNAQVLNISPNQQGRVLENTFAPRLDLTGDGTNDPLPANVISNTVRTPVVEPILSLDKKITSGPAQPKPGDTITFTVNIGHAAGSGATAWETLFTDTLPAGLQFVSVSTQASGGAVVTKAATFDGSGHVTGLFDIPVGGKITITYQVKVAANVKSGATLVNGADIQWTSAPGDDINERKSGDSLLNKGGLNDYELKAQAQLTVSNPPPPTPFLYFYDRFNKWHRKELDRTLPLGGLYVVESPDNYRPPILPLAPIYSGEADPGSTLVLTLTNANGETIGTQMVVVDAGGNWMATFPTTTIRDFPNSVRIDQINAFYSLSDSPGHNLRAYYSPALSSGHFFFEELRTIAQDTEAPLLSGLAIENPLGEGTTKYGGEMLSTQGVAGGY